MNIWLRGAVNLPHLMTYLSVGRNWKATLMVDHAPPFDLVALHPEYAQRHYGGTRASYWSELHSQLGVRLFVSVDPIMRLVQGPNALALWAD